MLNMIKHNVFRFTVAVVAAMLIVPSCQPLDALPEPQAVVSYDVGVRPRAIATADLNGDGALDVAVANSADGTVSILVGVGGGRLRSAVGSPFPAGREPSDVDAADLDRDGDVDLAFANHETSRITILLNDGRARFAAAPGSPFETGARPHVHSLATGDFDGDGWLDVAVESADSKEVRILRGGSRSFGEVVAVSLGTMPYFRLGAANVVGDEHPDVLVPGHGDSTVRVVQRAGSRMALAAWNIRLSDKPWMVVGDDVNGDRRTDIVVVHSDAVSIWLAGRDSYSQARGSPFPVRGATEVATGDLDGDGVADVAVGPWDGDEVTVLSGRELTVRKVRTCERPIGLAIADLDGDRRGELLAACANHNRLVVVTMVVSR
jgi:hypothetical protein